MSSINITAFQMSKLRNTWFNLVFKDAQMIKGLNTPSLLLSLSSPTL